MAKLTEKVTLGNGDLYLNAVEVGHLKGTVEFIYAVERVEFKPANTLGTVKMFKISETATLKATLAELRLANVKLALGVDTTIGSSVSFPEYDPSSYVAPASFSADVLTIGGDKTVVEVPLRFEHTRPDTGMKFIIILYNAVTDSDLTLPFNEDTINLSDVTFRGLSDATRTEGDQIGVLIEQVAGSTS